MSELTSCPRCGGKIRVIDTDALEKSVSRVRRCGQCGRLFETVETVSAVRYEGAVDQPRA